MVRHMSRCPRRKETREGQLNALWRETDASLLQHQVNTLQVEVVPSSTRKEGKGKKLNKPFLNAQNCRKRDPQKFRCNLMLCLRRKRRSFLSIHHNFILIVYIVILCNLKFITLTEEAAAQNGLFFNESKRLLTNISGENSAKFRQSKKEFLDTKLGEENQQLVTKVFETLTTVALNMNKVVQLKSEKSRKLRPNKKISIFFDKPKIGQLNQQNLPHDVRSSPRRVRRSDFLSTLLNFNAQVTEEMPSTESSSEEGVTSYEKIYPNTFYPETLSDGNKKQLHLFQDKLSDKDFDTNTNYDRTVKDYITSDYFYMSTGSNTISTIASLYNNKTSYDKDAEDMNSKFKIEGKDSFSQTQSFLGSSKAERRKNINNSESIKYAPKSSTTKTQKILPSKGSTDGLLNHLVVHDNEKDNVKQYIPKSTTYGQLNTLSSPTHTSVQSETIDETISVDKGLKIGSGIQSVGSNFHKSITPVFTSSKFTSESVTHQKPLINKKSNEQGLFNQLLVPDTDKDKNDGKPTSQKFSTPSTFYTTQNVLEQDDAKIILDTNSDPASKPPRKIVNEKSFEATFSQSVSKKTYAIGLILIVCVAVAISINFINLHSDYQDLKDFYRGYMGRKLLIMEGRLTSRAYIYQLKGFDPNPRGKVYMETSLSYDKPISNGHANDFETQVVLERDRLLPTSTQTNRGPDANAGVSTISCQDQSRRLNSTCSSFRSSSGNNLRQNCCSTSSRYGHVRPPSSTTTTLLTDDCQSDQIRSLSNYPNHNNGGCISHVRTQRFQTERDRIINGPIPNVSIIAIQEKVNDPFSSITPSPMEFETIVFRPESTRSAHEAADRIIRDRTHYLQQHLPLLANDYIEDHDPEWRDLDYCAEVGPPPESFCQFIIQYDLSIFSVENLNNSEICRRRNLLHQFRKWKRRKRKLWTIVVTERAKKEMADQEKNNGLRK